MSDPVGYSGVKSALDRVDHTQKHLAHLGLCDSLRPIGSVSTYYRPLGSNDVYNDIGVQVGKLSSDGKIIATGSVL
jgi:hypothetical protein